MCRGFQQNDFLKIKSFYLRLSVSSKTHHTHLPDSLTLQYLPRINGSPLEINHSKILSHSPAFVTLYRVVSAPIQGPMVYFGSREQVKASEGARFEVYLGDEKVLKGFFRKDWNDEWKIECSCGLENEQMQVVIKEAEICVAAEGGVVMSEKVAMVVKRKRRAVSARCLLEEIPEEREMSEEDASCCCCCSSSVIEEEDEEGMELELGLSWEKDQEQEKDGMEGLRWAIDIGIWVMCLGVGYMVSKASSKSLLTRKIFV